MCIRDSINPFDQPDVEAAKVAARTALQLQASSPVETGASSLTDLIEQLKRVTSKHDYVSIQAFVDRDSELAAHATELRERLAAELRVPVSLGWGPRYLHSTGQLHKGGPAVGTFVQIVDESAPELGIPAETAGFGSLLRAQADGDRDVLRNRGRTVLRFAQ